MLFTNIVFLNKRPAKTGECRA